MTIVQQPCKIVQNPCKLVQKPCRIAVGTGRSAGCGIVVFATAVDAAKAIEVLHASMLHGRPISVREGNFRSDGKVVPLCGMDPE